jgi:tetratricopeptide (TPR) repeat protein
MALIRCPDCEKEVSSRAHSCPQCAYPIDSLTNFSEAILQKDSTMVRDLLHAGFKIDEPNSDGYTPLMVACQQGHVDITKLLVDAGAGLDLEGKDNTTAIAEAAANGHDRIVELLREKGATPPASSLPEPEVEEEDDEFEDIIEPEDEKEEAILPPAVPEPVPVETNIPPVGPPPLPVEAKSAVRLRMIDEFAPAVDDEKYSGPGFVCRTCQHDIAPDAIWCPHCKAPIIRRYCGGCRELIPDNAARCPYCNSSKLNRFRYIRNLEQIVAGTVVLGVLLFLFGIYNPANTTSYAKKLAEKRSIQQEQIAKADEKEISRTVRKSSYTSRTQTPTEPAVVRIVPRQTDRQVVEAGGNTSESRNQIPTVERIDVDSDPAPKDVLETQRKPELEEPKKEEEQPQNGSSEVARRLNEEGFRLMKRGRYSDAIPVLAQALRSYPPGKRSLNYAYALYNLGRSLRLAGRPDLAIPILEERMKFADQRHIVARELELAKMEVNGPEQFDNVQFE